LTPQWEIKMAVCSLLIRYRPLRVGFLVQEGNIQQLLEAASLCTVIWGGVYNPIIPVKKDCDLTDRLIRLFRVDVLYPMTDSESLMRVFKKYSWLQWPNAFQKPGLLEESDGTTVTITDVFPVFYSYWKTDFRRNRESRSIFPKWDPSDPLHNLLVLQFGKYPTNMKYDYPKAYEEIMHAQNVRLEVGRKVPKEWSDKLVPIDITRKHLLPDSINYWWHHGLYIGDPSDFEDLLNFWNLRASGMHLVFCARDFSQRLKDFVSTFLDMLWHKLQRRNQPDRYIGIWAKRDSDHDSLQSEIVEIFPKSAQKLFCLVDEDTWNGLNVKPPIYRSDYHTVLANLDKQPQGNPLITFLLPPKPLPNAAVRDLNIVRQQWVVSIQPLTEYGYEGFTLRPPYIPDLNEWFGRQISFDPWKLRVEYDGIGLIKYLSTNTVSLRPIQISELIKQIFKFAGIEAKSSQGGRIAERLIIQCSGLEGCRVFKIPGVRKLIANKDARVGITRGRATNIIFDKDEKGYSSFEAHKTLYIEPREKKDLDTSDVFDYLLKKGLMRAGLLLKCPNCEFDFWVSIDSLSDTCKCEYCGHTFSLGPQLKDRDWRFRLSGLFGRVNTVRDLSYEKLWSKLRELLPKDRLIRDEDINSIAKRLYRYLTEVDPAEGAVPVALTLLQLLRRHRGTEAFLYTTGLELKGEDINCEIDLTVVESNRGKVSILIGECKANLEVDDTDIDNMLKVKNRLEKAGLQCFLLFSKTAPFFTADELRRFSKLHERGIQFILFTSKNLEPYDPYWNNDVKNVVPYPYASTLEEMAQNSVALYLKGTEGETRG